MLNNEMTDIEFHFLFFVRNSCRSTCWNSKCEVVDLIVNTRALSSSTGFFISKVIEES